MSHNYERLSPSSKALKNSVGFDLSKKKNLNRMDPEVRPVVKLLYDKGFITYASCQGHSYIKGYPGVFGYPEIIYKSTPALDRVFRKCGFIVTRLRNPFKRHLKGVKKARYPTKIKQLKHYKSPVPLSAKMRKNLWKRTYKEMNKLRSIK